MQLRKRRTSPSPSSGRMVGVNSVRGEPFDKLRWALSNNEWNQLVQGFFTLVKHTTNGTYFVLLDDFMVA